ncbi:MAG: mitomycin antibiotics/polyketide fumonisin biosynthesis protein [Gammaproteobacteria bacterium]|nr:mitomycin antibiotics/polyketide fumonisin biosynthesis protein [Gammaproteobacteria bacterium]
MNEEEAYLFDLRGFIVVKNALQPNQIDDLSRRLEAHRSSNPSPILGSDRTILDDDAGAWSASSLLELGGTYLDLVNLPTIAPYLTKLLGEHYRLDHDYAKIDSKMPEREKTLYLHGGGQGAGGPADLVGPSDGGQCFYRYSNGRFFNGLVAVAFELDDVQASDGGFACVPGSHKSNIGLPAAWRHSKTQAEVPDFVQRVAAAAGDAIIFTEACAHGTVPWEGKPGSERRTLFYKYCPHAVAWSPCYYNADNYPDLSAEQQQLLMPPSAFGNHAVSQKIWERAQNEQQELSQRRAQNQEST